MQQSQGTDEDKFAVERTSPELKPLHTSTPAKSRKGKDESLQNVPGSQDPRNSPGKKKGRSSRKENKENSGPQSQKSPNTSVSSTSLLLL
ncbi:MAG: hypothetical protein ACR5K9_05355 [Wolbachia sp.]